MTGQSTRHFARADIVPGTLVLFYDPGERVARLARFRRYGIARQSSRTNDGSWTDVRVAYTEPELRGDSGVPEKRLRPIKNEHPCAIAATFLEILYEKLPGLEGPAANKPLRFRVEGDVDIEVDVAKPVETADQYTWVVSVSGQLVAQATDLLHRSAMGALIEQLRAKGREDS
jgi:hypothetical protein